MYRIIFHVILLLSGTLVLFTLGDTRAADPTTAVYERMTPGIQIGHFDHDQDRVPVAEVNAEYIDSVKAAGFLTERLN